MSVNPRLHRLFTQNGKCLQVALDHGLAHEYTSLSGVENMEKVVSSIAAANPDGMILTIGQAHWLQDLTQNPKPALVLRADAMNVYSSPTPREVFCKFVDEAVEQAVALDAAAIVVNLFWLVEHPGLHWQCVENIMHFKPLCDRYGMPLIVEPMALIPREQGGFKAIADIRETVALARLAVELGADVVKADIDENVHEYHKVVEAAAPRPLLPRGGAKVSDQEILTRTHTLLQQGAAGVIYGRNIFQHAHPERMVRACQAMIHEGASVATATKILEGSG